jgi:integrase
VRAKRKGGLAAYRDATLFKVIYAWGLRRREAARLDVADWGGNPAAPEFGRYGMLHVRYGKAVRGQPPRRRVADAAHCGDLHDLPTHRTRLDLHGHRQTVVPGMQKAPASLRRQR